MAANSIPEIPGLSRRTLLAAAALVGLVPGRGMAQHAGVLKGVNFNHVNLQVSDLAASGAFFQRVFGMGPVRTVLPPGIDAYGVDFGGVMLTLHLRAKGGVSDHFDIGTVGFQPRRDGDALRAAGYQTRTQSDEYVFVTDPDGVGVQISDARYTAVCDYCAKPKVPPYRKIAPLLEARSFKYIHLKVASLEKSVAFYRGAFGLPPERPLTGRTGRAVALDVGPSFLLLDEEPGAQGRIAQFGLGIDNLRPKEDARKLRASGVTVEEGGGLLIVIAPDDVRVGVADSTWQG